MADKLERLMNLVATLLNTEYPLRAADIAERVEGYPTDPVAFRRAFERDKDDLRSMGVPLTIVSTPDEGQRDGYRIDRKDYYLHDLDLAPDEVVAISMAMQVIELDGATTQDALWKLGGVATQGEALAPQFAAIELGPSVTLMQKAIADRAAVRFGYRDAQRHVEPWSLDFRRGHWYLNGWDIDRQAERRFRLDRVEGDVVAESPGSATNDRTFGRDERQPWEFANDATERHHAKVRIDAEHASWACHLLGDDVVSQRYDDGSILVSLEVSNLNGFRSLVLSFLDGAEVIEPPELRQHIIDWLEAMA